MLTLWKALMETSYTYSLLLKATWAIYARITADIISKDDVDVAESVYKDLWLSVEAAMTPEDKKYLILGLRLIQESMGSTLERIGPSVLVIQSVDYTETDYQAEGMACAIMGWMHERFNITIPDIPVCFDKGKGYIYTFPKMT